MWYNNIVNINCLNGGRKMTKKQELLKEAERLNLRMQKVLEQLRQLEKLEQLEVKERDEDFEELETRIIKSFLKDLGCNYSLKGYKYVVDAVKLKYKNPEYKIMNIYKMVADKYSLKLCSVERCIRLVKQNVQNTENSLFLQLFGGYVNSNMSITNSMFIGISAEYISEIV